MKSFRPTHPTKAQMKALFGTDDITRPPDPDDNPDFLPDYSPKPKPTKRKRNPLRAYEDTLQKQVVKWFGKQYPDMEDLLCYNLNNSKNKIDGAINKAKGLRKGRNDLTLYYRGRALLLELKAKDGSQSDDQIEFQKKAQKHGNHYRLSDDLEQAKDIIRKFITWCDTLTPNQ